MDHTTEFRLDARFKHEAAILIEDFPIGTYHHGQMGNYSQAGMYFESNVAHAPGAPIIFGIEDTPYETCPGVYHGEVKWCRRLPDRDSSYDFGIGVEYFKPDPIAERRGKSKKKTEAPQRRTMSDGNAKRRKPPMPQIIAFELEPSENPPQTGAKANLRKHPRRTFGKPVLYATRSRFFKGTIRDISKGGVFIEAPDMMAVGQRLTLAIPSGKRRRGLKLRGEIVRIDPNGLAIQFKSLITN